MTPFSWLHPYLESNRPNYGEREVNLSFEDNDNYYLVEPSGRYKTKLPATTFYKKGRKFRRFPKYKSKKMEGFTKHEFDYGVLIFGLLPLFLLFGALWGHEFLRIKSGSSSPNIEVNVNTNNTASIGKNRNHTREMSNYYSCLGKKLWVFLHQKYLICWFQNRKMGSYVERSGRNQNRHAKP